jgi:hypothetical protein
VTLGVDAGAALAVLAAAMVGVALLGLGLVAADDDALPLVEELLLHAVTESTTMHAAISR